MLAKYGTPVGNNVIHPSKDGDPKLKGRLHGAWTGGFSAGYFNTVGSKEGWAPTSFQVTRADKDKSSTKRLREQRLEDFMDDEDKIDMEGGIDLVLNPEFAEADAVVRALSGGGQGFGYDMLRSMGWKGSTADNGENTTIADSSKGEGLGFETQAFSKRLSSPLALKKRKLTVDDEEEEAELTPLPRLLPKRKVGSKHRFVTRPKINPGTANMKCRDGVYTLPGFVLMNDPLLPVVKLDPIEVPSDFEAEALRAARRKRRFEDAEANSDDDGGVEAPTTPHEPHDTRLPIDSDTAAQALDNTTNKPYPDDSEKDLRYRRFLEYYAGRSGDLVSLGARELDEFTKVAYMFRPLQGAMASRFAGSGGGGGELISGGSKQKNPGRTVEEFYPNELLCRRFGLPYKEPPEASAVEGKRVDDSRAVESAEHSVTINPNRNEALECTKAPDEMFQMVFGDDDEDDEDERL